MNDNIDKKYRAAAWKWSKLHRQHDMEVEREFQAYDRDDERAAERSADKQFEIAAKITEIESSVPKSQLKIWKREHDSDTEFMKGLRAMTGGAA